MADPIVVAAFASGAAFVLVVVLVAVLRRRDPVGHAVAGYAVTLQALRDTTARTTSSPSAPRRSRDAPPTVSVITIQEGTEQGTQSRDTVT